MLSHCGIHGTASAIIATKERWNFFPFPKNPSPISDLKSSLFDLFFCSTWQFQWQLLCFIKDSIVPWPTHSSLMSEENKWFLQEFAAFLYWALCFHSRSFTSQSSLFCNTCQISCLWRAQISLVSALSISSIYFWLK